LSGKITLASELPAITDAERLIIDGRKARIEVSGNNQVQVVSPQGMSCNIGAYEKKVKRHH
jgi:hypothetical protein